MASALPSAGGVYEPCYQIPNSPVSLPDPCHSHACLIPASCLRWPAQHFSSALRFPAISRGRTDQRHSGNCRTPLRRNRICSEAESLNAQASSSVLGLAGTLREGPTITPESGQVSAQALAPANGTAVGAAPAVRVTDRVTGGARDFAGANMPLVMEPLVHEKKIVLVRHGLSSWNEESRVQGSSDLSLLSEKGKVQALKCREALRKINFDVCFSSPIERAKSSAKLIWEDREEPLVYLDSLREANLLFLEGMKNEDAEKQHPELYRAWRQEPENFHVHGVYPVRNLWNEARKAWQDILRAEGKTILVVTHKSILRALLCTSLGMEPDRFRAVDLNNGGVCIFSINRRGEPMLQALNMTAHLHTDNVYYEL